MRRGEECFEHCSVYHFCTTSRDRCQTCRLPPASRSRRIQYHYSRVNIDITIQVEFMGSCAKSPLRKYRAFSMYMSESPLELIISSQCQIHPDVESKEIKEPRK